MVSIVDLPTSKILSRILSFLLRRERIIVRFIIGRQLWIGSVSVLRGRVVLELAEVVLGEAVVHRVLEFKKSSLNLKITDNN